MCDARQKLSCAARLCLTTAAARDPSDPPLPLEAATPRPAAEISLTREEERAWMRLPPDRSAIPVLLYHGIGPPSAFSNAGDAAYGVGFDDFARQMTMIAHAGYETVDLRTFVSFVRGRRVELPPRSLLLTFDDARAGSWTGADAILRRLGFTAVVFVDVGRVEAGDAEYLTWPQLRRLSAGGRWELQLHSGKGHVQIRHGPGDDDYGPFYAFAEPGEDIASVRQLRPGRHERPADRGRSAPLAALPPDPRGRMRAAGDRYDAVFTQDRDARARPGADPPFGRIQVDRAMTGGELLELLRTGGP